MTHTKIARLKPISLYPLSVERALSAFMAVKPRKVEKRLARDRKSIKDS